MNAPALPANLKANPRLDRWVRFEPNETVTVRSGKVELGQGIVTAMAQIAAEELDVALERLVLVPCDTSVSPEEAYTAGSLSIEHGGAALRMACAEVRQLFIAAAAREFEVDPSELRIHDGVIELPGTDRRTSYWALAASVDLARDASGTATAKDARERHVVGQSVRRRDLPAKISGGAFIHDIELGGMVHGRVLRPPSYSARLESFDAAAVRALPGVCAVFVSGSFVGLCAEREEQAVKALEVARRAARWRAGAELPDPVEIRELLPRLPSERSVIDLKAAVAAPAVTRLAATYSKPFIAHASIGLSCALAQWADGKLTVWSHTQGTFPLRAQLAPALGITETDITVVHRDGAGCYGHNGADDVALDAALLARAAGRPVRVQWSREDELAWSPYGSAMVLALDAGLDAAGNIVDWRHELWSHTYVARPGRSAGINLLAAWHLDPPAPVPPAKDNPLPAGGAHRNAIPLYDFPQQEIVYNFIPGATLRASALRSLGAFGNVFALESFMDELAVAAGVDPIEFRLRHLRDERGRAVIGAAAAAAGWQPQAESDGTHGRGIGFARYKNMSGYCAVVAEIEVGEKIRLVRMIAAVDVGQVVNPDGLRNQIEGGVVQAASWTLKEQVRWNRERVTTRKWDDYPILKFDETPDLEVVIVASDAPSLGAGECMTGPTAAAIANALHHAMGVRVRDLPITPERIVATIG